MRTTDPVAEARQRLIDIGGRTSQDLGAGRIVGQVLVYLYLQEEPCSLDQVCGDLGLSKASVSIASRQLEKLGLVRKVWKKGDRKNYYRSAQNIGSALQNGLLILVRQKVQLFGAELELALTKLEGVAENDADPGEIEFLNQRISRARNLQKRLNLFLDNPLVNLLTGSSSSTDVDK